MQILEQIDTRDVCTPGYVFELLTATVCKWSEPITHLLHTHTRYTLPYSPRPVSAMFSLWSHLSTRYMLK